MSLTEPTCWLEYVARVRIALVVRVPDVLGLSKKMAQGVSSYEHDIGMICPTQKISNMFKSVGDLG